MAFFSVLYRPTMANHIAEITSFQNPLVKKIRSLAYKKYRKREGVFWAEGVRNTLEAIDNAIEMRCTANDQLRYCRVCSSARWISEREPVAASRD